VLTEYAKHYNRALQQPPATPHPRPSRSPPTTPQPTTSDTNTVRHGPTGSMGCSTHISRSSDVCSISGTHRFEEIAPGQWQEIVSEDKWRAAVARLASSMLPGLAGRTGPTPRYLLSGLAALVARSLNLEPSLHASMRASAM
jgi:hypothetical protein